MVSIGQSRAINQCDWLYCSLLARVTTTAEMFAKDAFDNLCVLHVRNLAHELNSHEIETLLKRLGAKDTRIFLSACPTRNVS